jgi:hypothetical protein
MSDNLKIQATHRRRYAYVSLPSPRPLKCRLIASAPIFSPNGPSEPSNWAGQKLKSKSSMKIELTRARASSLATALPREPMKWPRARSQSFSAWKLRRCHATPALRLLPRVASRVLQWRSSASDCYAGTSVWMGCGAGSNQVRAQTEFHPPRRGNRPRQPLERWSAGLHPIPQIFHRLTPQQAGQSGQPPVPNSFCSWCKNFPKILQPPPKLKP